jgi:hypothetical protein
MKFKRTIFLFTCLSLLAAVSISQAAVVEWDVKKTLNLKDAPLDLAVSKNGKWIFILTGAGEIAIYSATGHLEDTIAVGSHVNRIKEGPEDNLLLVSDRENKTVQVVALDFIQKINTTGAPVRGNADAPVTIALFAEFQ